jgi:DNA ligase-1
MLPGFKPMLSGKVPDDLDKIRYPVLASTKLDGIRCVVDEHGNAFTRNMKPVPNEYVRAKIKLAGLRNLDGELVVGEPTGNDVINRTSSGVMARTGEPLFRYYVFDCFDNPPYHFEWRLEDAVKKVNKARKAGHLWVHRVPHIILGNSQHLTEFAERKVAEGYEGAMLRSMDGKYKFGRATTKEGGLLKYKFFEDAEARVVGAVELMHNENEQTRDELGRSKRSKKKSGLVATGKLGALVCEFKGKRFEIGTGFTEQQRVSYWRLAKEASHFDGSPFPLASFKYQGLTPDGVPRFPVFREFRNDI